MARFILILILISVSSAVHADFLGFKTSEGDSKISEITEKIKSLKVEPGPIFEDKLNQLVKTLEMSIEEEKLLCAGESVDSSGKVISKDQRQVCFRQLKSNYLEAVENIFNIKKKYLTLIHQKQLDSLNQIQSNLKKDIEKSF